MIVADNGSDWYVSGAPDPRWSNDDLHSLGRVPGSAFEVVDTVLAPPRLDAIVHDPLISRSGASIADREACAFSPRSRSFPCSSSAGSCGGSLARAAPRTDRVGDRRPVGRGRLPEPVGSAARRHRGARARCTSTRPGRPSGSSSSPGGSATRLRGVRRDDDAPRARLPPERSTGPPPIRSRTRRSASRVVGHDLRDPDPRARELPHGRGRATRPTTNCFAIQAMAWTAMQLGAPQDEAELLALAMEALEPGQGSEYGTNECRRGLRLDLHPETADFPTELPIARTRWAREARAAVSCGRDPRQRRHPHARPVASDRGSARDRRADHRRRRGDPRVDAPHARARRPRGPLRPPRVHRLTRALPDLGARAPRRAARAGDVGRGGARARRGASRAAVRWIRGTGWRDAAWPDRPTAAALDAVTGTTPAALWSKDYHSLWLNSAGLAVAKGDLDVAGGVVERDADGAPTGVLREESAWRFRERFVDDHRGRVGRGDARGDPRRERPRGRRDPRQGRLARSRVDLRSDPRARGPLAPRVAVDPRRPARRRSQRFRCRRASATTSSVSAT